MIKEIDIAVSPIVASDSVILQKFVSNYLALKQNEISGIKILKRSIDARSRNIKIHLKLSVFINELLTTEELIIKYPDVSSKPSVIIIGAGPAGLFAALRLIKLGLKPIILERGKDVQSRRRDLAAINKEHIVNPESNYCFGEGGAGTYSDGKLYTRSTKRGDVQKILETLVFHGASSDILIDAHPHIGTNKLPKLIQNIRQTILNSGGEIHFNSKVTDLIIQNNCTKGVRTTENEFTSDAVILATGHSARDIFELLHSKNILIEAKPFAMGVRAEHPQSLIDSMQYHCSTDEVNSIREHLPAAAYSWVHQSMGRGVYSFCMCPGGIIAPCATSPGEIVTNGWSPSKRNNPYANSGIVVSIEAEDYKKYSSQGALAGLRYQQEIEQLAFEAGGKTQTAPAQRLIDFVNNKTSSSLPETSYQPGVKSFPLHELLPSSISKRLQEGFSAYGKKAKSYFTNEAVLVAVESRTSSPVRIPRDKETLQHIQIKGLFPCGEGAGYAGGIVSAAIDGEKCAEATLTLFNI